MLDLQEIPVAGSTRKTYLSALDKLDEWLKGREVNDENLSAYLSYLFDRGKSPVCGNITPAAARWRRLSQDLPGPRGKLCRNALKIFPAAGCRTRPGAS